MKASPPSPKQLPSACTNCLSLVSYLSPQNQLEPHGFVLHPKTFSHVLQVVQLEEGLRWSYLPADQLWRKPWDEPRCFDSSVASVSGCEPSEAWPVMTGAFLQGSCEAGFGTRYLFRIMQLYDEMISLLLFSCVCC